VSLNLLATKALLICQESSELSSVKISLKDLIKIENKMSSLGISNSPDLLQKIIDDAEGKESSELLGDLEDEELEEETEDSGPQSLVEIVSSTSDSWMRYQSECYKDRAKKLKLFRMGYEVYECVQKVCHRPVYTHPDYVNLFGTKYNWLDIPHDIRPICKRCQHFLLRKEPAVIGPEDKITNETYLMPDLIMKFPTLKSEWSPQPVPNYKVRVALDAVPDARTQALEHPHCMPISRTKYYPKNDGDQRRPTGQINEAIRYPGENIFRATFARITLSPLLAQNRGIFLNQSWYSSSFQKDFNFYEPMKETEFHFEVLSKLAVEDYAILFTCPRDMEPQSKLTFATSEEALNFYHPITLLSLTAEKYDTYMVQFKTEERYDAIDVRRITMDYHCFKTLLNTYQELLSEEQQRIAFEEFKEYNEINPKRPFYAVSNYYNTWTDDDIEAVFRNFNNPGAVFTERNITLLKAHCFLDAKRSEQYRFMDYVSKFRTMVHLIHVTRNYTGPNRLPSNDLARPAHYSNFVGIPSDYEIPLNLYPQIRYVVSIHRPRLRASPEEQELLAKVTSTVKPFEFPDTWFKSEELLTKFCSKYPDMSPVEKEIVSRHFFCYANFGLKEPRTEYIAMYQMMSYEEYLATVRDYIAQTLMYQSTQQKTIIEIGNRIFDDNHGISIAQFLYRQESLNSNMEVLFQTVHGKPSSSSSSITNTPAKTGTNTRESNAKSTTVQKHVSSKVSKKRAIHVADSYLRVRDPYAITIVKYYFMDNANVAKFNDFTSDISSFRIDEQEANTKGKTLLCCITNINIRYDIYPYESQPKYDFMRSVLVEQLLQHFTETPPNFMFETVESDPSANVFTQRYVDCMRKDQAYLDLLTREQIRNRVSIIDEDPQNEVTRYINNKLVSTVELTKLDAVQLAICFDKNVVIFDMFNSERASTVPAKEFHIFDDDDTSRLTWVLVYNTIRISEDYSESYFMRVL